MMISTLVPLRGIFFPLFIDLFVYLLFPYQGNNLCLGVTKQAVS
jgi:hypothetical protein